MATAILLHPTAEPAPTSPGRSSRTSTTCRSPSAAREPGDPRPKTHSLYAILPAALVSRDLAAGMLAHFARDLALDPGLPLLGGRHFRVPYGAYALLVLASAYSRSRPC